MKNIYEIQYSMKSLVTYIKEQLGINKGCFVQEMSFACKKLKWGKWQYRVAIHGADTKDRPYPHIHIYDANDSKPGLTFNFEVSLIDILCKDEINLVAQKDYRKRKRLYISNKSKCSWEGYSDILDNFEDWLMDKSNRPGEFKDNLDFLIWSYNDETLSETKALQKYIEEQGLKILHKYQWYIDNNREE